jgi:hypothetical protein
MKKNEQFPLSCPQAPPPRRGGAVGRSNIVATLGGEKSGLLRVSAYILPAASRAGTRPSGLGETQAVTTHRPNSSSWVGGRVLIVKVMVWGGRRSIRAAAELGPGEMNACVNEGAGWWSRCRNLNAKGRTLEPMSGTACQCVVRPKDRRSMMWMEGIGWLGLGGLPTCELEGTKARNQCQEPLVSCDHRAWIEATCCSPRREIRAAKCRGMNAGTADGEQCRSCNHTAWDS